MRARSPPLVNSQLTSDFPRVMTMPEPSSIKRHSIDARSEYERDSSSQEVPHTYSRSNGVPRSATQSYPSYDHSHEPYGPGPSIAVHPLSYSEANPTAPVGHIIHQPYQSPRFSPIESETYRFNAGFDAPDPQDNVNRSSTLSQARNRCAKKIGQRRDSTDGYAPAGQAISRRTSSSMEVKGSQSIIKAEESDPRLPDAMIRAGPPRHRTFHAPTVSSKPRPSQNYREMEAAALETVSQAAQNTVAKIKSVPISGLISAEDAPYNKSFPGPAVFTPTEPPPPTYRMEIRQQPIAARACGFGERDRRVIDPPPILQMVMVGGDEGTKTTYPCGVVHATLWHADKEMDDTMMPETGDRRQQRRLMGSGVASPFIGKDEHDVEGCFFTFSDLSCRTSGRYRLRFVLVIVDPENMGPGSRAAFQSVVISDVFQVYAAKDFPGMRTSTELTKRLKEQGCLISVKKGNEKALEGPGKGKKATHIRDDSDEEEEDDDDNDDDEEGIKSKGRKTKKQKK